MDLWSSAATFCPLRFFMKHAALLTVSCVNRIADTGMSVVWLAAREASQALSALFGLPGQQVFYYTLNALSYPLPLPSSMSLSPVAGLAGCAGSARKIDTFAKSFYLGSYLENALPGHVANSSPPDGKGSRKGQREGNRDPARFTRSLPRSTRSTDMRSFRRVLRGNAFGRRVLAESACDCHSSFDSSFPGGARLYIL